MDRKHTAGAWLPLEMHRGNYGTPREKWEIVPIVVATCGLPEGNGPNARICELPAGESAFRIGKVNGSHTISLDEARANARLVAAAPRLLAAALVITTTEHVRAFLLASDPKALEQLERAIAATEAI